ncbi:MAG: serine hydrolase [Gammaproteobacteria bacterium]|nr:serine hydrolase [Gammaproteobacteria bacterium]
MPKFSLSSILVASVLASLSPGAASPQEHAITLDDGRRMVEEADRADYFFWKRLLFRLDNQTEFGLPAEWYTPNRLIEGGVGATLPRRVADNDILSDTGWQAVADWAFARGTDSLIVMKDGVIVQERWGDDADAGMLMPVRSMAKTLPGLLVGRAIAQGQIRSVDDPLSTYLTEWKDDPRGAITLRQILTQTSGLATIPLEYTPDNWQIRLAEGSDVNATALDWPLEGPPDRRWTINQVDSQILALVLERATGHDYIDYLSRELWRPLGADTSTMNVDAKGQARAFCCMRSRLYDWLRVGELIRLDGRVGDRQVIPAEWLSQMRTAAPVNPYVGYHLWIGWKPGTPEVKGEPFLQVPHTAPYRADDVVYLLGGSIMTVWVVPSRGLTILRSGKNPDDWDHSYIVNAIIDDLDRHEAP